MKLLILISILLVSCSHNPKRSLSSVELCGSLKYEELVVGTRYDGFRYIIESSNAEVCANWGSAGPCPLTVDNIIISKNRDHIAFLKAALENHDYRRMGSSGPKVCLEEANIIRESSKVNIIDWFSGVRYQ